MELIIVIVIVFIITYLFMGYVFYRKYFDGELVSVKRKGKLSKKQKYHKAYYEAIEDSEFFENKAFKLTVKGEDNIVLNASLLRNKNSHDFIIMIHDLDGSSLETRQNALDYWRKGYNCLCVELKGHGQSKYVAKSLGFLDRLDILMWIERIKESDPYAKFILYGRGEGGACCLFTLCENNKDIKASIVDGAYGSIKSYLKNNLGFNYIYYPIIYLLVLFIQGFKIKDADVKDYLAKVDTPILFIQGNKDELVNMKMFEELYSLKKNNKDKVIFNCGHNDAFINEKEKYYESIDSFIENLI